MILERLKRETTDLHLATEAAMPFGDPGLDLQTYLRVLRRLHGFFLTWLALAATNQDEAHAPFGSEQRHLSAITKDMQFLGLQIQEDSMPAEYLPDLSITASLLGSLYVIEGSTLGGQLIARMLEKRFSLSQGNGYSYFLGAGPSTGQNWKAFGRLLIDWAESHPDQQDAMIAAARTTFQAYGRWVGSGIKQETSP